MFFSEMREGLISRTKGAGYSSWSVEEDRNGSFFYQKPKWRAPQKQDS